MRLVDLIEDPQDDAHQQALDDTGYWGRAGAGCMIMAHDTKRFLMPLRSDAVEEPGTWGTWGGAIDDGEDSAEAVRREVEEESGYTGKIVHAEHLYRYRDEGFRYDTFLVVVPNEFQPRLDWETERAEWVEYGDWPKPVHFGLQAVLDDHAAEEKIEAAVSS